MVNNRERRKLSLLNRLMLWFHYFILVCLAISVAAKHISPSLFWFPAFFGLAFPFIFVINAILIIYWLVQFKPQFIFGLVVLLIALPTSVRYFQISFNTTKANSKELKITSYNCMLFDLYNWRKNYQTRPKIMSNLYEINPDIICLQEFYTSEQVNDFHNIDTIKQLLRTPYYHCEYTTTLRKIDHWGIATFSKYPIINQGKLIFQTTSNNICIYSDIKIGNDTVRVYNIHLQSVSFSKKDNKFLEDVVSEKDAENEVSNSKNILRRLKRAFLKRASQVNMITTHLRTCKYKVILCGDFNDTAASYTYEELSKNLNDAFIEKGLGFGRTYAGKWPQFRIDYVLHSKTLKCTRFNRSDETFTDHYPITAFFSNINW